MTRMTSPAGIGIDDDFVNECSNEAFLQSDIRVRIPPSSLEVAARFSNSSPRWGPRADSG